MAACRIAQRGVARRQFDAPADGPFRRDPFAGRPPATDQLVPLSRTRVTPVPPLPEPAFDDHRRGRHRDRTRSRLRMEPVPAPLPLAGEHLLGSAGAPVGPLDCGDVGAAVTVHREHHRGRVRDQGLRVGRFRGLDPAVGDVDTSPGVGLHLAGDQRRAAVRAGCAAHLADSDVPLRDRVPGAAPDRAPSVAGALGAAKADRSGPGGACRITCRHRMGDRAPPVVGALGVDQRDPPRDAARERLRGPQGVGMAGHRATVRRRQGPARHDPCRRRARHLHRQIPRRALSGARRRAGHEHAPLVRQDDIRRAGGRPPR